MNKLSKYIIITAICAVVCVIAWYFRTVLIYIIIAAVVALIGKPLMRLLKRIHFKKLSIPTWCAAIITILTIFSVFFSLFLILTPLIGQITNQISNLDLTMIGNQISGPLNKYNSFIIRTFPSIDPTFRIEIFALNHLKDFVSISTFSTLFASITTIIVDFSVALFSIIFISFFFLMDEGMLTNTIVSMSSDKYEANIRRASDSISNLLTRYFLGISIESLCITILNGIGLIFIAKMDPSIAIVTAFVSGILNVIPYVGPLAGDCIAVLMGLMTHYSSGLDSPLGVYLIIILAIFIATQLIDNYIFQPLIYSNSVKAHPLEIFIVILLAGHIGGVIGMLIAIPAYTVIRVIANEFLSRFKIVQSLTRSIKEEEDTHPYNDTKL